MIKLMLKRGTRVTFTDIADSSTALSQFNTLIKTEQLPGQVCFFKADVGVYEQVTFAFGLYIANTGTTLYN